MNLNRKILSVRELALLGILIITAVYYFVIQGPVAKQTAAYEEKLAEINIQLEEAQVKMVEKARMEKAIEDIFQKYDENPPITPNYNNVNHIIGELNGILAETYDYNLTFDAESIDSNYENIVRRPIAISFSTSTYDMAIAKLRQINKSPNKYLIQNVTITRSDYGYNDYSGRASSQSKYTVVMTLTSFEYKEN